MQMLPGSCGSSWLPVIEGRAESFTNWVKSYTKVTQIGWVSLIKEIVAPVPGEVNIGFTPACFLLLCKGISIAELFVQV